MSQLNAEISRYWHELHMVRPLVHNITNYVTANFIANLLLAAGASPIMADARDEMEEIMAISSALHLNIGTINPETLGAMLAAGKAANRLGKPVVLDPVGVGASSLRAAIVQNITAEINITVIRGNSSEILTMSGYGPSGKGVDADSLMEEAEARAPLLATELKTIVAVTGPEDMVTDGKRAIKIKNGHPLLCRVTGTGCAVSALVAALAAVGADTILACAAALAAYGLAGQRAAQDAPGPGSFQAAFLDEIYALSPDDLIKHALVEEVSLT